MGRTLAERLDAVHIDTDGHFWIPTDPPYRHKRDICGRLARIAAEQARTGRRGTRPGWRGSTQRPSGSTIPGQPGLEPHHAPPGLPRRHRLRRQRSAGGEKGLAAARRAHAELDLLEGE